jgi:hypothetical protein
MPSNFMFEQEQGQNDWRHQRRATRRLVRSLPEPLRRQLLRIRRTDIQEDVASSILDRVHEIAEQRGLVREAVGNPKVRAKPLAAIHRRAILRGLASDTGYVQFVHRLVDQRLRTAHLEKVSSVPSLQLVEAPPPTGDPVTLDGSLGLGGASYADEAPDGFYTYAVDAFLKGAARSTTGGGGGLPVRALHLDPRAGSLARAVGAMAVSAGWRIQEVGAELEPTDLPAVARGRRFAIRPRSFDVAVWSIPSPAGPGASAQVQAYRHFDDPDLRRVRYRVGASVVSVPSPSAVGVRRWRRSVGEVLSRVILPALNERGMAVLRIPLCVRVTRRAAPGRAGFAGYFLDSRLPAEVPSILESAGLELRSSKIEEAGPVNQPFVGAAHGRWLLVIATPGEKAHA